MDGRPVPLRYLLDTNVLSEPTKPRPNPRITERLLSDWSQIATAAPAWNELLYGLYRLPPSARRSRIEEHVFRELAPTLPILPYDTAAAQWHAAERARLERAGCRPPFVDGQIAAVAYANGLTLVTANLADYANFQGITIEDWTA